MNLNNIRVTWQLGVVVCALAIIPIAGGALLSTIVERGQRSESTVQLVSGSIVLFCLAGMVLAVWARMREVFPEDRPRLKRDILLGLLIMVIGGVIGAALYHSASVESNGFRFFIIPTGIYLAGLIKISRGFTEFE